MPVAPISVQQNPEYAPIFLCLRGQHAPKKAVRFQWHRLSCLCSYDLLLRSGEIAAGLASQISPCLTPCHTQKKTPPSPSGGGIKISRLVYFPTLPASPCQNTQIDNKRSNSTRSRFSGKGLSRPKAYTGIPTVASASLSRSISLRVTFPPPIPPFCNFASPTVLNMRCDRQAPAFCAGTGERPIRNSPLDTSP